MSSEYKAEGRRLQDIAKDSWYTKGIAPETIFYSGQIFMRHIVKNSAVLELGPAEGAMTSILARQTDDLTVVEGAGHFCHLLRQNYPAVKIEEALFEDFQPKRSYDAIVMGHVLEHVVDPVAILKKAAEWLSPGGKILAAVPNARSVHREAAVLMGLIPSIYHLNESDLHHGHRRVLDSQSFRKIFEDAGLTIELLGGYWLKPLSNAQIESSWTPQMLQAFMKLGEKHPEIAAEIYVVAAIGRTP